MLEARDASDNALTSGGDIFMAEIYNQCTMDSYLRCTSAGGASVITESIKAQMDDNNDGTYYYDFSVAALGTITINIVHVKQGIQIYYFPNLDYTGTAGYSEVTSNINFTWGEPIPGVDKYSAYLGFYFVPNKTDDYTFSGSHDNFGEYTMDDTLISIATGSFSSVSNVNNFSYLINLATKSYCRTILQIRYELY
jgi:hypothetical protein